MSGPKAKNVTNSEAHPQPYENKHIFKRNWNARNENKINCKVNAKENQTPLFFCAGAPCALNKRISSSRGGMLREHNVFNILPRPRAS